MSINLYPDEVHQAQLGEPEYTPEIDEACNKIYKATKGMGTDEQALIAALASKNTIERSLIAYRYKEIYDTDLKELMKKENSGDFGFLTELLSLSAIDAEAKIVRKATKGLGTKEELLYSVICGRSNAEIDLLKKAYFKRYNKDLSNLISSELGGDIKKLALACLQGMEEDYDPNYHTESKAKEEAKAFYKAGQGKRLGTDEAALFEIICKSPPQFLKMIDSAYVDQYNNNIERALEKCLHGKCEKAAIFTLGMKLKPYETVAALIKSRCAGAGTNEVGLSCDILRYQNILQKVQMAHVDLYSKTIGDRIMDETSGDYEKLLLQIVKVAWPDTQSSDLPQMIADVRISSVGEGDGNRTFGQLIGNLLQYPLSPRPADNPDSEDGRFNEVGLPGFKGSGPRVETAAEVWVHPYGTAKRWSGIALPENYLTIYEGGELNVEWKDQGWGNRKGHIWGRILGEDNEVLQKWARISQHTAEHNYKKETFQLPSVWFEQSQDGAAVIGKTLELYCEIGGGGGHSLFIKEGGRLKFISRPTPLPPQKIEEEEVTVAL